MGTAASSLPSPVWAVVDLYGKCTEVTIVNPAGPAPHLGDLNLGFTAKDLINLRHLSLFSLFVFHTTAYIHSLLPILFLESFAFSLFFNLLFLSLSLSLHVLLPLRFPFSNFHSSSLFPRSPTPSFCGSWLAVDVKRSTNRGLHLSRPRSTRPSAVLRWARLTCCSRGRSIHGVSNDDHWRQRSQHSGWWPQRVDSTDFFNKWRPNCERCPLRRRCWWWRWWWWSHKWQWWRSTVRKFDSNVHTTASAASIPREVRHASSAEQRSAYSGEEPALRRV